VIPVQDGLLLPVLAGERAVMANTAQERP